MDLNVPSIAWGHLRTTAGRKTNASSHNIKKKDEVINPRERERERERERGREGGREKGG